MGGSLSFSALFEYNLTQFTVDTKLLSITSPGLDSLLVLLNIWSLLVYLLYRVLPLSPLSPPAWGHVWLLSIAKLSTTVTGIWEALSNYSPMNPTLQWVPTQYQVLCWELGINGRKDLVPVISEGRERQMKKLLYHKRCCRQKHREGIAFSKIKIDSLGPVILWKCLVIYFLKCIIYTFHTEASWDHLYLFLGVSSCLSSSILQNCDSQPWL